MARSGAESARELFVDTGAFIARYDADDQHHQEATAAWAHLAPPGWGSSGEERTSQRRETGVVHPVAETPSPSPGRERWRLVTSGGVLGETFTLLGRRAGFPFAAIVAQAILDSPSFSIRWGDPGLAGNALVLFSKFADRSVSWIDCESFAIMRGSRITRAFTFDRHFEDAGFHRWTG